MGVTREQRLETSAPCSGPAVSGWRWVPGDLVPNPNRLPSPTGHCCRTHSRTQSSGQSSLRPPSSEQLTHLFGVGSHPSFLAPRPAGELGLHRFRIRLPSRTAPSPCRPDTQQRRDPSSAQLSSAIYKYPARVPPAVRHMSSLRPGR